MNEMPTKTPTGVELAIQGLIRLLGIKPEMVLGPLAEIRDKVVGFDARQDRLEQRINALEAHLAKIASQQESFNHGTDTGRPGGSNAGGTETGQ